jgi:DNA polymerase III epsilon subunit-like protein
LTTINQGRVRGDSSDFPEYTRFFIMQDDRYLYDKTRGYVVFDVETTGLRLWRNDRIIEIGAVAVNG